MRSIAYCSLGFVALFVSVMGCEVYADSTGDDRQSREKVEGSPGSATGDQGGVLANQGEENVGTAEQAHVNFRGDKISTITVSTGSWGVWKDTAYCKEGTWAIGYTIRDHGVNIALVDDTGLNSVRLSCQAFDGSQRNEVVSYNGIWGLWEPTPYSCSGGSAFLKGAQLDIQPFQGASKDDAGAVAVQFSCSDGEILPAKGTPAGSWKGYAGCPAGSAVCGLSIRFEDPSTSGGDETAMNGLKLECCRAVYQ